MNDIKAAVCRYERNAGTVQKAVALADAFAHLPRGAKVVIKPNIVAWINGPFPKWGVITTSAIMEETVVLLKEYGISDIAIVEGSLQMTPEDTHIGEKAFAGLGLSETQTKIRGEAHGCVGTPL